MDERSQTVLKRNRLLGLGLLLACSAGHSEVPAIEFTPQQLFAGRSEGNGSLTFVFGRPRIFHVESYGIRRPDGSFRLDQTITFAGRPSTNRYWIIRPESPNAYAGTLSGAAGEVSARTDGDRLILRYRLKGLFVMRQTLELMADGKTIDNSARITLLGVPIGWLHETILRSEPTTQHASDPRN